MDLDSLHTLCPDPQTFAREYECVFDSEFSSFINADDLVFADGDESSPYEAIYFGMDIGRHNDRTAISILGKKQNRLHLIDVVTLKNTEYEEQINVLKQLHQKYKFSGGLIDATGIGNPMAERINKTVNTRFQGFNFTGSNKTPMHENLRALVFERNITFNSELKKQLINDFANIARIVTPSGDIKYQAGRTSESGHSDITSSLLLAIEASNRFKLNFGLPAPVSFGTRF